MTGKVPVLAIHGIVIIEDDMVNISRSAKLVENASSSRLLPVMISTLRLPIIDSDGQHFAQPSAPQVAMYEVRCAVADVEHGDLVRMVRSS
jgi:hypothetical protein